ncbi:helix-turn-helix domain-containing protein [Aquimarina sp. 2201CG1-2-11]|uniref:helix-turn-helix domain-containing protein n=1 Tax=Aquimarina discodermiae TaxID=3231043 RepID=UPI00346243E0
MSLSNQLVFFFSALGAFNGFILALYFALMAKKKNFSNYFLALLLLMLSIRIIKSVFFYFNPKLANVFIQIGLSACILIGPFLFLYLKSYSNSKKSNWAIHIVPYITAITIVGIIYPYVEYRKVWQLWIVTGIHFQWLFYIIFSVKYMKPIVRKLKEKEKLKNIDIWLLSIYFGVFIIWLGYLIGSYTSYIVGALSFSFVFYLMILLFVFKTAKKSTFFQEKEKYKNKELDHETIEHIKKTLSVLVKKELFLNPNLTLDETAKELKVSKHALSQYLNEQLYKSFSSFINEYRIEKAKELLQTKSNYTIESLGYDSGFNSKSTFFTNFKKITGQTPTEYQKNL